LVSWFAAFRLSLAILTLLFLFLFPRADIDEALSEEDQPSKVAPEKAKKSKPKKKEDTKAKKKEDKKRKRSPEDPEPPHHHPRDEDDDDNDGSAPGAGGPSTSRSKGGAPHGGGASTAAEGSRGRRGAANTARTKLREMSLQAQRTITSRLSALSLRPQSTPGAATPATSVPGDESSPFLSSSRHDHARRPSVDPSEDTEATLAAIVPQHSRSLGRRFSTFFGRQGSRTPPPLADQATPNTGQPRHKFLSMTTFSRRRTTSTPILASPSALNSPLSASPSDAIDNSASVPAHGRRRPGVNLRTLFDPRARTNSAA